VNFVFIFIGLFGVFLFVVCIRDLLIWCYKEGYQRGWKDSEQAWVKLGREVDEARQQIWREEGAKQ
jgi:hypothetical protein